MSNYERHPTLRTVYIAYDAAGFAFRVRRGGDWIGSPSYAAAAGDYRFFSGATLREVCAKIGASRRAVTA